MSNLKNNHTQSISVLRTTIFLAHDEPTDWIPQTLLLLPIQTTTPILPHFTFKPQLFSLTQFSFLTHRAWIQTTQHKQFLTSLTLNHRFRNFRQIPRFRTQPVYFFTITFPAPFSQLTNEVSLSPFSYTEAFFPPILSEQHDAPSYMTDKYCFNNSPTNTLCLKFQILNSFN